MATRVGDDPPHKCPRDTDLALCNIKNNEIMGNSVFDIPASARHAPLIQ